jgi:hypothetical protein
MIYSRWRPDRGGYDYYESGERRGLGDDMPIPRLLPVGELGAASTEAGRRAPGGVRHVGSGEIARGAILPLDRAGLSGLTTVLDSVPTWVLLAASITLGWVLGRGSRGA